MIKQALPILTLMLLANCNTAFAQAAMGNVARYELNIMENELTATAFQTKANAKLKRFATLFNLLVNPATEDEVFNGAFLELNAMVLDAPQEGRKVKRAKSLVNLDKEFFKSEKMNGIKFEVSKTVNYFKSEFASAAVSLTGKRDNQGLVRFKMLAIVINQEKAFGANRRMVKEVVFDKLEMQDF